MALLALKGKFIENPEIAGIIQKFNCNAIDSSPMNVICTIFSNKDEMSCELNLMSINMHIEEIQ